MADTIRWLTTQEAADRACCGPRTVLRAVRSGRLRAARIRGELRFLGRWIDEWLINQVMPEDGDIAVAIDAAPSSLSDLLPWR
ncbi:MAG TPA: helix-turn-helix domain-containing protein [Vicinamibacterales bacterium]|nr:helix-turn-helix domain-containing protein [Vicinamibacterales bacterium]HWI16261.1 helix-turn-helix domain-containing protein [Vicinamibacterales bacterium]